MIGAITFSKKEREICPIKPVNNSREGFEDENLDDLLEAVVGDSDGDLPPVAAQLVDRLDLVACLVFVALQEVLHVVLEALKR